MGFLTKHGFIALGVVLLSVAAMFSQATKPHSEAERFRMAADYSKQRLGVAILVMKGDKIVFEEYAIEAGRDMPWILASGTKSFSGVMLAAAIEDSLISGFDEKVADTITEWRSDKRKAQITLRQLLSLTSGIEAGQIGVVPTYSEAIFKPAPHEPGAHFEYGSVPFQIFGEVMTRKLKPKNETVMAYLKRRILDPIGLSVAYWRTSQGQPLLPQGATLTAREWVKFGLLLKNQGKWNGKQIVDSKLLAELTLGSKANPAYGITFWLNSAGIGSSGGERPGLLSGNGVGAKPVEGKPEVYMAAGAGNQRLYIIPSEDLVVLRFGAFGGYDDREFLSKLLNGK